MTLGIVVGRGNAAHAGDRRWTSTHRRSAEEPWPARFLAALPSAFIEYLLRLAPLKHERALKRRGPP